MTRKVLFFLILFLPVLILIPHLDQFIFQPGSQYSDILITHYPNAIFIQNTIRQSDVIPLWSPAILSGYPFAANPLSGLHYLPGWLAYLFPLPLGFNLTILLHILWGGMGIYLFMRQQGLSFEAAILSALIFESLPKLFGHLGAGHLSLIYAVCWTPWLLTIEHRLPSRAFAKYFLPGAILGVITLADIRWIPYAGMIWAVYSLYLWLSRTIAKTHPALTIGNTLLGWLITRFTNILFALLIASPLLLPLAQYTALSTRSQLTAADNLTLSLPPSQLIGLVYPNIGGSAEWIVYPGAVVFGLMLYALVDPAARRRSLFWFGIMLITIFLSLGSYIPFLKYFYMLPGLHLLRVPPRILFLSGLAFSIVAGFSLQTLYTGTRQREQPVKGYRNLVLFGATALVVLFAVAVWVMVPSFLARIQFGWGASFFLIAALLIFLVHKTNTSKRTLIILLTSACMVDLMGVNGLSLVFSTPGQVLAEREGVVEFLASRVDSKNYRIYSPSYSIPQQTAARYGLELADGVDPMQLTTYAHYMQGATGVISTSYSVTLPPFATGNPGQDNLESIPDARRLGLLNVKYIAAEFPLERSEFSLLARIDGTYLYQNPYFYPRAWIQPLESKIGENITEVDLQRPNPNELQIQAKGPGLLVLSEIAYPGWKVTIDGRPAQIIDVDGLFRGISVPDGEHKIILEFSPILFTVGIGVSGASWAFFITVYLMEKRRQHVGGERRSELLGAQ